MVGFLERDIGGRGLSGLFLELGGIARCPTVRDFLNSRENVRDRFRDTAKEGKVPAMYVSCGTEDENVYPRFLAFRKLAEELGVDSITFRAVPGFRHEYALWDQELPRVFDYWGLAKKTRV